MKLQHVFNSQRTVKLSSNVSSYQATPLLFLFLENASIAKNMQVCVPSAGGCQNYGSTATDIKWDAGD